MRRIITIIMGALMLAVFGTLARAEEKDGLALLKDAQGLMQKLAVERLPAGDCGKDVQDDQQKIVDDFNTLIKMILDQSAAPEPSPSPKPGEPNPSPKPPMPGPPNSGNPQDGGKLGKDGKPLPSTQPGGNPNGGSQTSGDTEGTPTGWDPSLPDKTYGTTGMSHGSVTVPGYDDLLKRFRHTVAREISRLP